MAQQGTAPGLFLYEFLWRGRQPGDSAPPAFHVVLGSVSRDAFERERIDLTNAITPEQAEAMGFTLPKIVDAINTAMLAEAAHLRAHLAQAADVIATQEEELSAARTKLADIATA